MRKITAGLFISLDGVVEAPDQWHFPYFNDEMGAAINRTLGTADTVLLGRKTYDSFAGAWPDREAAGGADAGFAKALGDARKIVVSNQQLQLTWRNSEQLEGELIEAVTALKNEPGDTDIVMSGSVSVVRQLLVEGLLDELHLLVHPIALRTGMRLFEDGDTPIPLALLSSETFQTGVQNLVYGPAESPRDATYEDAKTHLPPPTRGRRASINGIDLYHEVQGTGSPLVVLHGGVLNAETCFGAMIPRLAEAHQVISVDLQGHGHTPDSDRPVTLANLAADVVGLLDHLGIGRADLFGFSLGSLVSIETAVTHPGRVGRLVLASGHIRADGYHPEIQDPEQMGVSPRLPTEEDFTAMKASYEATAPDPDHFFAFLEKLQPVVSAFEGWTDSAIRGIAAPTLLIVGDQDFVRLEHAALMLDLFPDAELAVLPGTTHMQVMQRTDAVLALVQPFLARTP